MPQRNINFSKELLSTLDMEAEANGFSFSEYIRVIVANRAEKLKTAALHNKKPAKTKRKKPYTIDQLLRMNEAERKHNIILDVPR